MQEEIYSITAKELKVTPPKAHIPVEIAMAVAHVEEIKAKIFRKKPKITREHFGVLSSDRIFDYSKAKDEMFAYTDTKQSTWYVVEADDKRKARLNCICHLLSMIPYDDVPRETITLPPLERDKAYVRPPMSEQTFVPNKY